MRHLICWQRPEGVLFPGMDWPIQSTFLLWLSECLNKNGTWLVYGVNDIYKCVRVFEIVVPELADLVLASHVPDVQLYIVEFHSFHVETDGGG